VGRGVARLWMCLSMLLASTGGASSSPAAQTPGIPQRHAEAAAALTGALATFTLAAPIAAAQSAPSPPFTECPAVGLDTSCGFLIVVTNSGITVLGDPSQGPYDGADDTLIGVLNNSSTTVTALQLSSSSPIFGFDGDGLCTASPHPAACPFGPAGYEGPGTSFSNINGSETLGQVNFSGGIAPGATAYFSLEEPVLVVGLPAQPAPSGGSTSVGVGTFGQNPPNEATSTDPVNTLTGNFAYTHTDVAIPGRGQSPVFVRSLNTRDTRAGPLGPGWTHNYAIHLANPGDGTSDVLLVGPQGRTDRYTAQSGAYTPPPGISTRLAANSNGTYTATLADQSTLSFNAQGQLTAITDRYGNQSSLSYTTLGQISSVTDPAGRGALTFGYDPNSGLLTSVTDWTGRVVRYGYDTNGPPRLRTVTDRINQVHAD
jgi:YD repeat-containing protein